MKHCPTVTLSRSQNCLVDYCPDCQVMHLHLEAVTLKIQRDSLSALRDLLAEALDNLSRFENDTSALLAHFSNYRRSAPN